MSNEHLETIKAALGSARHFICDEYQCVDDEDLKEVYQEMIDELEAAIALFE
jgi:hypothetical protein